MAENILSKAVYLPQGEVPLRVIRIDNHHPMPQAHTHEFGELVIITHGQATHQVDSRRYRIRQGDVFVIHEGTPHAYLKPEALGLVNLLFDWPSLGLPEADLRMLPGYQALFEIEPRVRQRHHLRHRLRLSPLELEELLTPVARLERELQVRGPGYRFAALGHWMEIALHLSRAYGRQPLTGAAPKVGGLSRALGYMESHLGSPQSVESLAALAGMSPASFFRAFNEVLGSPPIRHLTRLRIDRAKRLLCDPRARIGDISEAVGFEDSNYFARQFRRFTGMSPRQWREFATSGS